MISAEHRGPLVAFALVCAAAAAVMGDGLRGDAVRVLLDRGAPAVAVGAIAPDMVLAHQFEARDTGSQAVPVLAVHGTRGPAPAAPPSPPTFVAAQRATAVPVLVTRSAPALTGGSRRSVAKAAPKPGPKQTLKQTVRPATGASKGTVGKEQVKPHPVESSSRAGTRTSLAATVSHGRGHSAPAQHAKKHAKKHASKHAAKVRQHGRH